MARYPAATACKLAQVSYRQLDYWIRAGVINGGAPGSGGVRYVSDVEIRVAYVLGRLSELGIGPASAFAQLVGDHVRNHALEGQVRNAAGFLIVDLDAFDDPLVHAKRAS